MMQIIILCFEFSEYPAKAVRDKIEQMQLNGKSKAIQDTLN